MTKYRKKPKVNACGKWQSGDAPINEFILSFGDNSAVFAITIDNEKDAKIFDEVFKYWMPIPPLPKT